MSYAPLWLEIVVTSMLFTATSMALSARCRSLLRWFVLLPNVFVFLCLCAAASVAGFLKYGLRFPVNFFAFALSLLLACLLGAILMQRLGARRRAGMTRASATWKIGQLLAGTAVCAAVVGLTLWNMDLEVRIQAEQTRARAGEIMLSVAPANVPDALNAAVPYEAAFKALQTEKSSAQASNPLFGWGDSEATSKQIEDLLQRQAGTVRLLREAGRLQVCRFAHDYGRPSVDMLLPELSQARAAARLLKMDATHQLAMGELKVALADVDAIFALSRAVGQEPFLIAGLVDISIHGIACESLASVLPAVQNKSDLDALHVGDVASVSQIIQRDLLGEEAFGLAVFADIGSGRGSLNALQAAPFIHTLSVRERIADLPFRIFFLTTDLQGYQQLMAQTQQWSVKPYYEVTDQMHSDEAARIRESGILTKIISPAFDRLQGQIAKAMAMHEAAMLAIAVTRYHLDHAALPNSLAVLVPQYIDAVPIDPFDGQPMRYRKSPGDWRVYSVGPDGKDDGGREFDHSKHAGIVGLVVKNSLK